MIRLDPTKIIRIDPSWWAKGREPDFYFVEATSQLSSLIALATKLTDAYSQLMRSSLSNFSSAYKGKKKSHDAKMKRQAVGSNQRPDHKVSYSAPTISPSPS